MTFIFNRIRPAGLLRAQVIVVAVSVALAVALFLIALGFIRGRLQDSSDRTAAALLAFRVHDELSRSLVVLSDRADQAIDDQLPGSRPALRQVLFGAGTPPADFLVPLSMREAATLQSSYDALVDDAQHLYDESPSNRNQLLLNEIKTLQTPLNAYLNGPTGINFQRLYSAVAGVEEHARAAIPDLVGQANSEDSSLRNGVEKGGYAVLMVLVLLAALLIFATVAVSQRVRQMYDEAERERLHLLQTTRSLQHRNEQMNALYTVFAEITDTLSLRYVVNAALSEAIKLMNCQTAVLRLVKDGQLRVAGSMTADGGEVQALHDTALGVDPVGRVAKRGKPLLIGSHNQHLLTDRHHRDGMVSGLLIPLIIGARVVGTLSVWSNEPDAFNEEDERILGMMGSQIATAVVAADTTDTSEHRARHDPLTGLPNRLRLMEDMSRDFNPLAMAERTAVVGMVDIDHFKHFNDDFGHHVGDVSLQRVALTLQQSLRENDRVYRYGGEEFVVLMDVDAEEGVALADRVRTAVENTPLTGDQLEPVGPITISMGLAYYPGDGKEFGSLIEMADIAMYRAKAKGRNQLATWSRDVVGDGPVSDAVA